MRKLQQILVSMTLVASGLAEARAGYIQVDLNPYANANFRQGPYQTVAALPTGGTTISVGGTPFTLATFSAQPGTTGIVQVGPNPGAVTAPPSSVDIAVNIAGATEVDTLINSVYGSLNQLSGQIQFLGTGGAFASFDLVQGVNIRDYNVGSVFNNTIAAGTSTVTYTSTTPTAGGTLATRLDRQVFLLPTAFAGQTLTTIRLVSASGSTFAGSPFLAAVNVNAVPEPGSAALIGVSATIGLGVLGLRRPGTARA